MRSVARWMSRRARPAASPDGCAWRGCSGSTPCQSPSMAPWSSPTTARKKSQSGRRWVASHRAARVRRPIAWVSASPIRRLFAAEGHGKPYVHSLRRVAAEAPLELGQEVGGPRGGDGARVVRAPRHEAARAGRPAQVHVGRVEDDHAPVDAGPPRREARALLPHRVGDGVELHRGEAAPRLRREAGRHVLPGEPGALRRPVVEGESRGAPPERGEGGQLALVHHLFGQRRLEPVETDGQHAGTRHVTPSPFSAGPQPGAARGPAAGAGAGRALRA